jgi:hypothetical protein
MGKVWKRRWLATQLEIANAKADTMIENVSTIKTSTTIKVDDITDIGSTGVDTIGTTTRITDTATTVTKKANTKAKKGSTDASKAD